MDNTQGITFYAIAEAEAPEPWPGWTTPGHDLGTRPARWLKRSEYYELIERERRAPWLLTLGLCGLLILAAGVVALATRF